MERRVTINHKNPPKWGNLTAETRERLCILKTAAIRWMSVNQGKELSWETVNKTGLFHWYTWFSDDYNNCHQWTKIVVSKTGVKIIKNV